MCRAFIGELGRAVDVAAQDGSEAVARARNSGHTEIEEFGVVTGRVCEETVRAQLTGETLEEDSFYGVPLLWVATRKMVQCNAMAELLERDRGDTPITVAMEVKLSNDQV